MGVAGHHQLVPVGGELVEDAGLRGVGQAQRQVGVGVRWPAEAVVVVAVEVRVIHTSDSQTEPPDGEVHPPVCGVLPAVFDERRTHPLPRQLDIAGFVALAEQVVEGIDRVRCVVVVAAEDEDAGAAQQRSQRLEHRGHGLLLAEVVTGVDHQVGVQCGEGGHPCLLGLLVGQHVQVGDVQDGEPLPVPVRQGAGLQDRDGHFVQSEGAGFRERGRGDAQADRTDRTDGVGEGAHQAGGSAGSGGRGCVVSGCASIHRRQCTGVAATASSSLSSLSSSPS